MRMTAAAAAAAVHMQLRNFFISNLAAPAAAAAASHMHGVRVLRASGLLASGFMRAAAAAEGERKK